MIAMQYSFTLPADYDMATIDRRIRDKGPLLDNLPGLRFKAYLSSRKGDSTTGADENRYAPFYVWSQDEALSDFVCGPAFAGLTGAFGWPQIRTWMVWKAELTQTIRKARFATRQIIAITAHAPLADLRREDSIAAQSDVSEAGALASVAGFEPTNWTRVRFQLWRDLPVRLPADAQVYDVGHVSAPPSV
jgi:hypothetical protein